VKGNVCTRFLADLILRKTLNVGVSVSIVSYPSRTKLEHASLDDFGETFYGSEGLPELIETA